MIKYSRYRLFIWLTLFFMILGWNTNAQIGITVTGQWDHVVSPFDITEAGLDFQGTYTSGTNQVEIDIFQQNFFANLLSNYLWRVDIQLIPIDWNSNLTLEARRSGNGIPFFINGTISGGTSFFQLSTANQVFFQGRRSRYNVPVQYRSSGVSVLLPAKTYTTTVLYTVTEL